MNNLQAVSCIDNVLSSTVLFDESIDYQLTTDDCEWLECAKRALTKMDSLEHMPTIPCKVGDIVYSYLHEWARVKEVGAYQITNIIMTQNKQGKWTKKFRAMLVKDGRRIDKQLNFSFHELGKTVFTDEETAKQLLL